MAAKKFTATQLTDIPELPKSIEVEASYENTLRLNSFLQHVTSGQIKLVEKAQYIKHDDYPSIITFIWEGEYNGTVVYQIELID